ncbi:MAG TPA: PAS domain-containing protein [Burkholderiaceae bacterium]|nr:PAS domain-containing protein [Burkholderiaceae bacterium]
MPQFSAVSPSSRIALAWLAASALVLVWPGEAAAMMRSLGLQLDTRERIWLSAFSGFSLGLALGLMIYELRARGIAIKLRRLKDLAASVDGRFADEAPRGKIGHEFERLSDEVLFTARRINKERREFDNQATAWQAMFAATLDSMFVLDAKGLVKDLNPAAERQFKINAAEAVGKPLADLLFPVEHRALDNAAFMQDLAAGKAVGRRQELIVHCGQRQFPVEMAVAEFCVADETGLIVTARDISVQRQTRADLKRVREQADRLQARLRSELGARRPGRDAPPTLPPDALVLSRVDGGTPFTLEDACGDLIRRLVVKAERKGLGFRYEDSEVQGMGLIGDASRLRAVVSELIDSVIRHSTHGEIVVHFSATSKDERSIELTVSVISTGMTAEESTRVGRPVIVLPRLNGRSKARVVTDPTKRAVDVAGVETQVVISAENGVEFTAHMHYAVDLSRVAIDLGALAGVPSAKPADEEADPRDVAEFARAAARLRQNADKGNLGALWAQAHRLKEVWLPRAPLSEAGLVSALAHTARGGDAANACMLARRLAEALDATVRQNMTVSEADIEEPVA